MKHNTFYLFTLCALCLLLTACGRERARFLIAVSQCSDDEWRTQMNKEIRREALFYPGVEVDIRSAGDDNARQTADIEHFIDQKADLIVVAPNEAEALTPAIEKSYQLRPLYRLHRCRQLRDGTPDRCLHRQSPERGR